MVVEIKRTGPGTSFLNRPVGVVNIKTGEEDIYKAKAKMFNAVSDIGFKIADQMQKKEATKAANEVQIRDENGNLTWQYVDNLGNFGRSQDEVNRIVAKRFLLASGNTFKTELTLLAQEAAANNTRTPVFKEQLNIYEQEQLKALKKLGTPDDVLSMVQQQIHGLSGSFLTARQVKNLELERDKAIRDYRISKTNFESDARNLPIELLDEALPVAINNALEEHPALGLPQSELETFLNNVTDNEIMNRFDTIMRANPNITIRQLKLLQAGNFDDPSLKVFSPLIKRLKTLDQTRRSEFNTQLSSAAQIKKTLLINQVHVSEVKSMQETNISLVPRNKEGETAENYLNQFENTTASTPETRLFQSDEAINEEALMPFVSTNTAINLDYFANFNLDPRFVPQMMKTLTIFENQALVRDSDLKMKFRNVKHGDKAIAVYRMLQEQQKRGPENLSSAYELMRGQSLDPELMSRNMAENLFGGMSDAIRDAGVRLSDTPEEKIDKMLDYKIGEYAKDFPPGTTKTLRGMLQFVSSHQNAPVDSIMENHIDLFFAPSQFMEKTAKGDSLYTMAPEYHLGNDPNTVARLRLEIENIARSAGLAFEDVALRTITSTDVGAQYFVYKIGGTHEPISGVDGVPYIIDTANYERAVEIQSQIDEKAILAIRQARLGEIPNKTLTKYYNVDFTQRSTSELFQIHRQLRGIKIFKIDGEEELRNQRLVDIESILEERTLGEGDVTARGSLDFRLGRYE